MKHRRAKRLRVAVLPLFALCALSLIAEENDWFVPLGPPPKADRKRISGGEGFPPLPLPVTPLRRSERKREPSPPTLIGKVVWGESATYTFHSGATTRIEDWNLVPSDLQNLLNVVRKRTQMHYNSKEVNLASFDPDPRRLPVLFFSGNRSIRFSDHQLEKLRAHVLEGGMIIADEVQYGFGRSGSHFWGFERYGITPDFVTLGKPIGNGIAVGCVVTTRAILDKFSAQHAFFSTFGGNPVACAAAGAVLDVIEREGLQQNARDTGGYLIDGLRELARGSARIGEVRGQGLFVGVDFVKDKASMAPDGALCSAIKDSLREQRILVSSDGYHGNVLKIRPPMVFSRENADLLIEGLRRSLNAL